MSNSPIGVLVMAYGGPNRIEDVEPYLLDVRGYRPTSPEIIAEVRERYRQIGGRSPILERTSAQAVALERELNARQSGFKTFVGMRHWLPFIQDSLAQMRAEGIQRSVGLVMAPHYSKMSVGAYFKKIEDAGRNLELCCIEEWHLLPGYLDGLRERVLQGLERFPAHLRASIPVIFTAHSLPERILSWGDPYPQQLRETAAALAQSLGLRQYEFAFQSAAISSEPWLGPDASVAIERLASESHQHLLIAPIGFVCEHVEVLYDIDIVYQAQAQRLGVQLERVEMLNTSPKMISALADLVRQNAQKAGWL